MTNMRVIRGPKGIPAQFVPALREIQHTAHELNTERYFVEQNLLKVAKEAALRVGSREPSTLQILNCTGVHISSKGDRLEVMSGALRHDDDALRALLAHEAGHSKNDTRNIWRKIYAKAVRNGSGIAALGAFACGNLVDKVASMHNPEHIAELEIVFAAIGLGVRQAILRTALPISRALNRRSERKADREAVIAYGPIAVIKFLSSFNKGEDGSAALDKILDGPRPKEPRSGGRVALTVSAIKETKSRLACSVYATHPKLEERIRHALDYALLHARENPEYAAEHGIVC